MGLEHVFLAVIDAIELDIAGAVRRTLLSHPFAECPDDGLYVEEVSPFGGLEDGSHLGSSQFSPSLGSVAFAITISGCAREHVSLRSICFCDGDIALPALR